MGLIDQMIAMALHQSYVTQWHSFTLISCYAIVFSFILMFTDNWFRFCMMALCIVSVYLLNHMKQLSTITKFCAW